MVEDFCACLESRRQPWDSPPTLGATSHTDSSLGDSRFERKREKRAESNGPLSALLSPERRRNTLSNAHHYSTMARSEHKQTAYIRHSIVVVHAYTPLTTLSAKQTARKSSECRSIDRLQLVYSSLTPHFHHPQPEVKHPESSSLLRLHASLHQPQVVSRSPTGMSSLLAV